MSATSIPKDFKGAAKRLEDIDLPAAGALIGVGEDEIHAVLDVETNGKGFDSQGRPRMLFEPHIFYRELTDAKQRDKAVKAGLAYQKWGEKPYPSDSYPRLKQAMEINRTAALRSASWGLGQIMGFNHKAAGYATVEEMVASFCESERNHLFAMVEFIRFNKLDVHLRNHNWDKFAAGYNGSGYAKHGYHTKLAAAYAKWAKIKDTPYPPPEPEPVPDPAVPEPPAQKGGLVASVIAFLAKIFGRTA